MDAVGNNSIEFNDTQLATHFYLIYDGSKVFLQQFFTLSFQIYSAKLIDRLNLLSCLVQVNPFGRLISSARSLLCCKSTCGREQLLQVAWWAFYPIRSTATVKYLPSICSISTLSDTKLSHSFPVDFKRTGDSRLLLQRWKWDGGVINIGSDSCRQRSRQHRQPQDWGNSIRE